MLRLVSLALFFASVSNLVSAQPSEIVIDGVFSDWDDKDPIYTDTQDGDPEGIDFERLWIDNDDRFLFVSIVVGSTEIALENGASFTMYLDNDNDPSTGEPFQGLGADLVWAFGAREGTFYASGTSLSVKHGDIGFIPAPTVTSARFEFMLPLDEVPRRLGPLFPVDTVAIGFAAAGGGDILPNNGERVVFGIDRDVADRAYDFNIGRSLPADLRVLAWNVERDGLFDSNRFRAYSDLIASIDPDVIAFSEIYDHSASETLDLLETMLPPNPGERWFGSDVGFDLVLVSRYPITRSFELQQRGAAAGHLLDLSSRGGSQLFLAVAHLRCCEANLERQLQIDETMASVRDLKENGTLAENTPIVVVGDMNFVGDSSQLRTLTDGEIVNVRYQPSFDPDWDGSPFADRIPMTTGVPAAYTWPGIGSGNEEGFSAGRLDFVAYSDFVLEPGRAFALDTRNIPLDKLQELGLGASSTVVASDHLPLVADFRGQSVTARDPDLFDPSDRRSSSMAPRPPDVYPNPAASSFSVAFRSPRSDRVKISVVDVLGRNVLAVSRSVYAGEQVVEVLDLGSVPAGFYIVQVTSAQISQDRSTTVIIR